MNRPPEVGWDLDLIANGSDKQSNIYLIKIGRIRLICSAVVAQKWLAELYYCHLTWTNVFTSPQCKIGPKEVSESCNWTSKNVVVIKVVFIISLFEMGTRPRTHTHTGAALLIMDDLCHLITLNCFWYQCEWVEARVYLLRPLLIGSFHFALKLNYREIYSLQVSTAAYQKKRNWPSI